MSNQQSSIRELKPNLNSWAKERSSICTESLDSATINYKEAPSLSTAKENLSEIRRRVLEVGSQLLPLKTTYPVHLNTELRISALANAGKLMRPCISVMTAHILNGDISAAYNYGWAIELLHLGSLILDDLPSMDDSKYRRGKLTIHITHGESFAILLATHSHNVAMEIIGKRSPDPETALRFFNATHEALGGMGLIGGQALDLEFRVKEPNFGFAEGYRKKAGFRDLWTMCAHFKTASLFRLSLYAGILTSSLPQETIEAVCRCGDRLGLVFQLLDDEADEDFSNVPGADRYQTLMTRKQRLDEAKAQRDAWRQELKEVLGERGNVLSEYFDLIAPLID